MLVKVARALVMVVRVQVKVVRVLVKAARVLGKAVTVLLESMRTFEGASPCRKMLSESVSAFLEAVIVLVSRVLYRGVDVLI